MIYFTLLTALRMIEFKICIVLLALWKLDKNISMTLVFISQGHKNKFLYVPANICKILYYKINFLTINFKIGTFFF